MQKGHRSRLHFLSELVCFFIRSTCFYGWVRRPSLWSLSDAQFCLNCFGRKDRKVETSEWRLKGSTPKQQLLSVHIQKVIPNPSYAITITSFLIFSYSYISWKLPRKPGWDSGKEGETDWWVSQGSEVKPELRAARRTEKEGRSIKKGWTGVPQCCQRGVCSQIDKGSVHSVSRQGKRGRRSGGRMEFWGLFPLAAWRARGWEEMRSSDACGREGTHKMPPSPALPQQLGFLKHQDIYSVK